MASMDENDLFGDGVDGVPATEEEEGEVFDVEGEDEIGGLEDSSPASGEQEHTCTHCRWENTPSPQRS